MMVGAKMMVGDSIKKKQPQVFYFIFGPPLSLRLYKSGLEILGAGKEAAGA